jgi:GNAT superfamily N-acetyltransferase
MTAPGATIWIAEADSQIERCFPVMFELRPHLVEETFVRLVRAMQREGFILAALEDGGEVRAVAGFRINVLLARGKNLYVDDLVTSEASRSHAYGATLLQWLIQYARDRDCDSFDLDSGVHRFRAHRFYFREGMHVGAYHFTLSLRDT